MLRSKRSDLVAAAVLMAPFVVVYGVLFVYPTIKMVQLSFTNAPLIGPGQWVGFANFERLWIDRLFNTAIWNTAYFVVLSVIPEHVILAMLVALGVNRLKGWIQSVVLAAFFLPYILPVSVVFNIWNWVFDKDFGIAQYAIAPFNGGQHVSIFRTVPLSCRRWPSSPSGGCWGSTSSSSSRASATFRREIYEAAGLDGANRWTTSPGSPGRWSGR